MNDKFVRERAMQQAAEWVDLLADGPLDEMSRYRLQQWLAAAPEHSVLLEKSMCLWHDPALGLALQQLIATHPPALIPAQTAGKHRARLPQWLRAAIAASVIGVMALGVLWQPWQAGPGARQFSTLIGQTQQTYLDDGSRLELGANTQLAVTLSPRSRRVDLQQGVAHFAVAPDKSRPFSVYINQGSVTAVGTAFSINKTASGSDILVYEGAVEVRPSPKAAVRLLRAGEQARLLPDALGDIHEFDPGKYIDWRAGWVEVHNESLALLIEQLNRYSHKPIELGDNSLAQRRIAGRFRLASTGESLELICALHGLSLREYDGKLVLFIDHSQ